MCPWCDVMWWVWHLPLWFPSPKPQSNYEGKHETDFTWNTFYKTPGTKVPGQYSKLARSTKNKESLRIVPAQRSLRRWSAKCGMLSWRKPWARKGTLWEKEGDRNDIWTLVLLMNQCWFLNCNKYTFLRQGANYKENWVWSIQKFSVLSSQFFCKCTNYSKKNSLLKHQEWRKENPYQRIPNNTGMNQGGA